MGPPKLRRRTPHEQRQFRRKAIHQELWTADKRRRLKMEVIAQRERSERHSEGKYPLSQKPGHSNDPRHTCWSIIHGKIFPRSEQPQDDGNQQDLVVKASSARIVAAAALSRLVARPPGLET